MRSILLVSNHSYEGYFSFLAEAHSCQVLEVSYLDLGKNKKLLCNEKNLIILDARERDAFNNFFKSDLRLNCDALIFVASDFTKESSLEELFRDLGVKGLVDLSQKSNLSIPLFRLAFDEWRNVIDYDDLDLIYKNLRDIGDNTDSELKRIKKIHEKLVPLRRNKVNGIDITAKYSAGEKIGGEFFDFLEVKGQLLFLLASTNSYLSSSMIMETFEELRDLSEFKLSGIQDFARKFYNAISQKEIPEVNKKVELVIGVIDMRKLSFWGVNFGSNAIVSNKQAFEIENKFNTPDVDIDSATFFKKVSRGEVCAIFSAGAKRNCRGLLDGRPWQREVISYLEKGAREALSEIFYRLKRDRESSFLEEDATTIIFEVNKNAIIQV